ncbi:MAG: sarcosine oxidase subunit gamma [Celeribacter sp.]|jgi:sarcosine oxidase subunit gamma
MSDAQMDGQGDRHSGRLCVTVSDCTPRWSLRVAPGDTAAMGAALQLDLPLRIGTIASDGPRMALCLGPDEWLLVAPLLPDLDAAPLHALTRIADRDQTITVTGPGAADLIAIGCPRDLRRIAPGTGCRTLFDEAQVVLWRDGPEAFRLDVWRSFLPHVMALLETGLRELRAEDALDTAEA